MSETISRCAREILCVSPMNGFSVPSLDARTRKLDFFPRVFNMSLLYIESYTPNNSSLYIQLNLFSSPVDRKLIAW